MSERQDILSPADIKLLVDSFYASVREDELIGPVFQARIQDWQPHLNTMYTFWETVVLDAYTYKGAPFSKHIDLPIHKAHFDRWIEIFETTVHRLFEGPNAENAISRAKQFGTVFRSKLEYLRGERHQM